jgi:hypothetical protein
LKNFFIALTYVLSGASRPTRILSLMKHELMAHLHGRWPAMLRRLMLDHPHIRPDPTGGSTKLTKLQDDIALAVAMASSKDFDEGNSKNASKST